MGLTERRVILCMWFVVASCASQPERAIESTPHVESIVEEETAEEIPEVDERVSTEPIDLGLEGEGGDVQISETGGATRLRTWRCKLPKECNGLPHQNRDGAWQCEEKRCVFRASSKKTKPIDVACEVDFDCPTHEYRCTKNRCVERRPR